MYGLVFGLGLKSCHGGVLIPSVIAKVRREGGFTEWKQLDLTNFVAALVELNVVDGEILTLIALRAAELYGQEPAAGAAIEQEEEENVFAPPPGLIFSDLIS